LFVDDQIIKQEKEHRKDNNRVDGKRAKGGLSIKKPLEEILIHKKGNPGI
jgi:hypothetical protein